MFTGRAAPTNDDQVAPLKAPFVSSYDLAHSERLNPLLQSIKESSLCVCACFCDTNTEQKSRGKYHQSLLLVRVLTAVEEQPHV